MYNRRKEDRPKELVQHIEGVIPQVGYSGTLFDGTGTSTSRGGLVPLHLTFDRCSFLG